MLLAFLILLREKHSTCGPTLLVGENLTSPLPEQRRIDKMAEFQINHEDLTGLKGKVIIITGMANCIVPPIDGIFVQRMVMHGGPD